MLFVMYTNIFHDDLLTKIQCLCRPAQKIISTAISIYRFWMEGTHCHGIFRSDLHFFETLPLLLKDVMHIFTATDYDEDFYVQRVRPSESMLK